MIILKNRDYWYEELNNYLKQIEKIKYNSENPVFLYHFTKLDSLKKMIIKESEFIELRFTHFKKYWDDENNQEFLHGYKQIKEEIKKSGLDEMYPINEFYSRVLNQYINPESDKKNYDGYIACFSNELDNNRLWEDYADNGNGIAIQFNYQKMTKYSLCPLLKVCYGDNQNISSIIKLTRNYSKRNFNSKCYPINEYDLVLLIIWHCCLDEIFCTKKTSFSEEKEYRLTFITGPLTIEKEKIPIEYSDNFPFKKSNEKSDYLYRLFKESDIEKIWVKNQNSKEKIIEHIGGNNPFSGKINFHQ